ncbi:CPBP family intramembrane glutamic endopeptidase [Blastopirellula marina]|uniref:CAAX prenyl protease 2/Lysostaphin resistance protein A-like domain-containing protein n=1 Tax=Blastopirellula marina TaxID=124 RepID=A0A2S8GIR4_9BACT|nr:CPBP family intramembrane glutamic endopeptidase [Blastopirellula marina]PQO44335.1 hypothetical protein C5Y93_20455 [Blastopirellula marina]
MGQVILGLAGLSLIIVLPVICIGGWTVAISRLLSGRPILQPEEGQPISWGLVDLFGLVLVVGIALAILQQIAVSMTGARLTGEPDSLNATQQAALIFAFSVAELLTVGVMCGLILLRGYGLQLFGQRGEQFISDLLLGLAAFGMLVVPTLIMQAILAYLMPYEHPLIDMLIKDKSVPMAFASVAAAVIAAPLFEEFAFRGLFQGWLQDMVDGRSSIANVFLGRVRFFAGGVPNDQSLFTAEEPATTEPVVVDDDVVTAELTEENPFHSPQQAPESPAPVTTIANRSWMQISAPIFVSALFFALMHWGQGLAPIPLFFLAIGLGYLYQRTRRLTPCIVVHFLLNGQSMALLLIQVFFVGDDAGALFAK